MINKHVFNMQITQRYREWSKYRGVAAGKHWSQINSGKHEMGGHHNEMTNTKRKAKMQSCQDALIGCPDNKE